MQKTSDITDFLRWWGVSTRPTGTPAEVVGDCPLCASSGRLYANPGKEVWSCRKCKRGGSLLQFLRHLWESSLTDSLEDLATDRGIPAAVLRLWGIRRSPVTGEIVVPAYAPDGTMVNLYRYTRNPMGKFVLLSSPKCHHGLFGVGLYDKSKPNLYLCEGPWDAMMVYHSLGGDAKATNVLAVPGCGVFNPDWTSLFSGKDVRILYDNDHPKEVKIPGSNPATHPPKVIQPAAYLGVVRVVGILNSASSPGKPKSVKYLRWSTSSDTSIYHDTGLPSGYDLRDALQKVASPRDRIHTLSQLLAKCTVLEGKAVVNVSSEPVLTPLPCESWESLENAWGKGLFWSPKLSRGLSVILASCTSVEIAGEQLWIKLVSPPSGGKTTLVEGLGVSKQYVLMRSIIRGFHSGYKSDATGDEDCSLLAQLQGKTLITKDGDTLLQSPNLEQIQSEARDIYDGSSSVSYRNKINREYQGLNLTWILCGTSSLRAIDTSELGERFLTCVLMDDIDTSVERSINRHKLSSLREMMSSSPQVHNNNPSGNKALEEAKRLTGGYLEYLRKVVVEKIKGVRFPEEAEEELIRLGTYVAYMRSRPSTKQTEDVHRELSTRLVSQLGKLAYCLAVVLQRESIDSEVLSRVRGVALDTAHGNTARLCQSLYKVGREGVETPRLAVWVGLEEKMTGNLLRFLAALKVVEMFTPEKVSLATRGRWRLTKHLRELFDVVKPGIE